MCDSNLKMVRFRKEIYNSSKRAGMKKYFILIVLADGLTKYPGKE